MEVQNTRTSEARPKRKEKTKHVQNLENTLRIPLSPTFWHYATFFWIAPNGPPSFVSLFCNTMDVKKYQRVPPFTFFGTVTLFKNHIFKKILGNFLKSKGPPFTILSLRYGADFGRSRLVSPTQFARRQTKDKSEVTLQ